MEREFRKGVRQVRRDDGEEFQEEIMVSSLNFLEIFCKVKVGKCSLDLAFWVFWIMVENGFIGGWEWMLE